MESTSLDAPAPSEPVHNVMPFAGDSMAPTTKARSSAFETTRGRPISGRGGSSGWIAMRTPTSSATGMTARRNRARLSRTARIDLTIAVEHPAQAWDVVPVVGARQSRHDVGEELAAVPRKTGRTIPSRGSKRPRVICFGPFALEHETVEGRELVCVEAQRRPAAGPSEAEFPFGSSRAPAASCSRPS